MWTLINYLLTKAADLFPKWYEQYHQGKTEHQHDFVLEAIGADSCLSPDAVDPESVSLESIDTRLRIQQLAESHRAHECGIPAIEDNNRKPRIKAILNNMVIAGKLNRGRCVNTYRIRK